MESQIPLKHLQAMRKVQVIFSRVTKILKPYLNPEDMSQIGVHMSKVDLAEEEQTPLYFRPAKKEWLASFDDRRPLVRSLATSKYASTSVQTYYESMAVQGNITQHFNEIHYENIENEVWEYYWYGFTSWMEKQ